MSFLKYYKDVLGTEEYQDGENLEFHMTADGKNAVLYLTARNTTDKKILLREIYSGEKKIPAKYLSGDSGLIGAHEKTSIKISIPIEELENYTGNLSFRMRIYKIFGERKEGEINE